MPKVTKNRIPQKPARRGPVKFKGITKDAARLGVSRQHLWEVLLGRRKSDGLLARYRELQAAKLPSQFTVPMRRA